MQYNSISVKGNRKTNEDRVLSTILDQEHSLHFIVDGMGGLQKGEIAAETISETINEFFQIHFQKVHPEDLIHAAITLANNSIGKIAKEYQCKLGACIAGVYLKNNSAFSFWVGDVKVAVVRDGKLYFQSKEHSLLNALKETKETSRNVGWGNIRHVVTRSIQGERNKFEPDMVELCIKEGDKIIICSDGALELFRDILDLFENIQQFGLESLQGRFKSNKDNSSIIEIKR